MKVETYIHRSRIPAAAEDVFAWHARPGAFARLNPPWVPAEFVSSTGGIENGARAELRVPIGPFRRRWVAVHEDYQPGRQFRDVQVAGPFAHWRHTHTMTPEGNDACLLEDHIEYALPGGFLGRCLAGNPIRGMLEAMFTYRHRVTAADIAAHQATKDAPAMKILVSGSTGLIGSQLVPFLTTGGHDVVRLTRSGATGDDLVRWNIADGTIEQARLAGCDAVVHLAGENIAAGRWTDAQKRRIRDSRVAGTRMLCEALAKMEALPKVLVCASAIGYYGDQGDEELDETASPGEGFLAEVCREWEAAAEPAREKGIRVVHLRFGVVLSPNGGALQKMLTPFKLGAGGVVGNGKQFWSWIALDDVVGAIHHALITEQLAGPANVVAPNPVDNRGFTKTLGRVLKRPTIFPMPAFAARLALGQMADELLLASARVLPRRLSETGYEFRFPQLEEALRHVLGR